MRFTEPNEISFNRKQPPWARASCPSSPCKRPNALKSCVSYALENCDDDLQYFESVTEAGLRDRLRNILERPFVRLTYTEAIAKLEEDIAARSMRPKTQCPLTVRGPRRRPSAAFTVVCNRLLA